MHDIAGIIAPYLLSLANRNDPICVAPPKVDAFSDVLHGVLVSIGVGIEGAEILY
jgi:hypothetical protein